MSSTPSRPGVDLAPFNFRFLDGPESAPSLMDRVALNRSLLQDTEQRNLAFAQGALLNTQQVQQHRLALAQLAGEQNVNAARAAADVAVTESAYQAANDDATWREANATDLASARAALPAILDAINAESDPLRLRDAAITFHGRYAHLAQDPVLGEQYQALDRRVAARLQARDEEFRARISAAAGALRPYIDPANPDQLPAIRADPRYLLARLDPAFAQQIDEATQQAAILGLPPISPHGTALFAENSGPTPSASLPATPPSSSSEPDLSFGNAWKTGAANIENTSSRPTVDGVIAPGDLTADGKKSGGFARPTALSGSSLQFLSKAVEQGQTSNDTTIVPPTPANDPASLGGMASLTLPPSPPAYLPTTPTPSLAPRQLTLSGRALATGGLYGAGLTKDGGPDSPQQADIGANTQQRVEAPNSTTLEDQLSALQSADRIWNKKQSGNPRNRLGEGSPYRERIVAIQNAIALRDQLAAFAELVRLNRLQREGNLGFWEKLKVDREIHRLGHIVFGEDIIGITEDGRPIPDPTEEIMGMAAPIGRTGKIGEIALRRLGGRPQAFFRTDWGRRFIDQLVKGMGYESKVGYTVLTDEVLVQIAKDAELIGKAQIRGSVWFFFRSPVTGARGPSQALQDALKAAGITWKWGRPLR